MQKLVVLVAGGNGFLGKRVTSLLQKQGHKVIIHSRKNKAVPTHADVIVNCVGIIREDNETFEDAHVVFAKWLVGLGKKLKVRQFVQVSAIGASKDGTRYERTKWQAEELVKTSGLPYAIIRPSMMFGEDDQSINRFRGVARTGFFPLFANGLVQPVSVDTVAGVVVAAVENRIRNRVAEVGGPEVFHYAGLLDRIHPGVHTFSMPRVFTVLFTIFGGWFTALPTNEQVEMLAQNNTTKDKTVERLGIKNPRLR